MMKEILNQTFDEERALYNSNSLIIKNCKFDGPKDGESALKESKDVKVIDSFFNLRYPFWHDEDVEIIHSELTEKCRAAIWYSKGVSIKDSIINGIKVFRECKDINIDNTKITSPEGLWFLDNVKITNSTIDSMYFLQRSKNIEIDSLTFTGKYSFQYTDTLTIRNSNLDTKDAFWHSNNVYVENSTIKGEYLGWYSNNLTLKNCTIIGTQPLCYANKLKIINCKFIDTDLAFEYSDVEADIDGSIISIKNPKSGYINVEKVEEIILNDSKIECNCLINVKS